MRTEVVPPESSLLTPFPRSSPSLLQSNSAESVAMGLLRQFEGMQLPAASEFEWLVPEHDAPQKVGGATVQRPLAQK